MTRVFVFVWMVCVVLLVAGCRGEADDDDDVQGDDDDATGDDDDTTDDDDDDTHPPADVEGTVWSPTLEWALDNATVDGNPYDLVATVTFVHDDTGESITTGMYYDADGAWHFRFTGTLTGMWRWTSASDDPELDGHEGTIWMDPNPGADGFVTGAGDKWIYSGTDRAIVPQLLMMAGPHYYAEDPAFVDDAIQIYMVEHGFSGFHIPVLCRWADLESDACDTVADTDPDPRTFASLEQFIVATHEAGGSVHFWAWGDQQRGMTPQEWDGLNGTDDQRIQRYIAARLGPLPGWTMGYGFDLDEWAVEEDLATWHSFMHEQLGWPHLLGGRSAGPNSGTDHSDDQIYEGLDYSGYEHHQPDYDVYVAAIEARPDKPTMSEDRFRVRDRYDKDYDEEMTRRGLVHSVMAGGVANIWGYLLDDGSGGDYDEGLSHHYPHPEWIHTSTTFFADRFAVDLERCPELTDGLCLSGPDDARYIFYAEDTDVIHMDLSGMDGSQPAVAVDTLLPYAEDDQGTLDPQDQDWTAPYVSDWIVAVGTF